MEGATVGNYRVLYKLGEGGMGAVYVAEHTLLGRKAAIKALLPELSAHKEIVQRFFNEAKAVTQITDPGIVQVFDFGYDSTGRAFIVMELLEGEPMDKRIARVGQLPPADCVRMMKQICSSLGAAHHKGIIHRDLKPENLFIVGDPAVTGGERAKILDFGIAKLSRDESTAKTRTGMMMGTPIYMSPEQCRGAGNVDHRSDIYSIGCVMMTMLTGKPPFEGSGSGELIVAHMRETPPLAASRVPGMPPQIDQVLQRALAKDPAQRFQSMAEMVQALAHVEAALFGYTPPPGSITSPYAAVPGSSPPYMPAPGSSPPYMASPTPALVGSGTGPHVAPTTLSSAVGQTGGTSTSRRGVFLGVAAVGLVAAITVVVLVATRGGGGSGSGSSTGSDEAAKQPGSNPPPAMIDAGVANVPPPPPAVDAAVVAVPADAAITPPPPADAAVATAPRDAGTSRPKKPPKPPNPGSGVKPHGTPDAGVDRGD